MTVDIKKQNNKDNFSFSVYDEEGESLDSDSSLQPDSASFSKQYDELSLYFFEGKKLKPLSQGEDILLGKQIAESKDDEKIDKARKRLAEGSFYFVVHLATEIKKQNGRLDIRELIQAGYLGLMTAVDKYDYKLGIRFSTFSYWWIKKAIYESLNSKQNIVRVPKWINELVGEYKNVSFKLRNALGREANLAEISDNMNLPLRKVELIAIAVHRDKTVYIDELKDQNKGIEGGFSTDVLRYD